MHLKRGCDSSSRGKPSSTTISSPQRPQSGAGCGYSRVWTPRSTRSGRVRCGLRSRCDPSRGKRGSNSSGAPRAHCRRKTPTTPQHSHPIPYTHTRPQATPRVAEPSPARQRRVALRDALGLVEGALQAHVGGVSALIKAPGHLVTAGCDGTVKLWEESKGRPIEVETGVEVVTCIDMEASRLVLGTASGAVLVWERDTQQTRPMECHYPPVAHGRSP